MSARPARIFVVLSLLDAAAFVPGGEGRGAAREVEVTPKTPSDMRLEVRVGLAWPARSVVLTTLPIRVTPADGSQRR